MRHSLFYVQQFRLRNGPPETRKVELTSIVLAVSAVLSNSKLAH